MKKMTKQLTKVHFVSSFIFPFGVGHRTKLKYKEVDLTSQLELLTDGEYVISSSS